MRSKIYTLALILAFILGISSFQAQGALAPSYLGQTTWTMIIIKDTFAPYMDGKSVTLTGGLTKLGVNYYSFEGYINDYFTTTNFPNMSPTPMILAGGGTLINGELRLTLSNSTSQLSDGGRYAGVMNVSLDTAANNYLNGNFSELTNYLVMNAQTFNNSVFTGTMTLTGNAIPLSPASLSPLSLMLLQ